MAASNACTDLSKNTPMRNNNVLLTLDDHFHFDSLGIWFWSSKIIETKNCTSWHGWYRGCPHQGSQAHPLSARSSQWSCPSESEGNLQFFSSWCTPGGLRFPTTKEIPKESLGDGKCWYPYNSVFLNHIRFKTPLLYNTLWNLIPGSPGMGQRHP